MAFTKQLKNFASLLWDPGFAGVSEMAFSNQKPWKLMVFTWGIPCQTLTPYQSFKIYKGFLPYAGPWLRSRVFDGIPKKNIYVIIDLECNIFTLDHMATTKQLKNFAALLWDPGFAGGSEMAFSNQNPEM